VGWIVWTKYKIIIGSVGDFSLLPKWKINSTNRHFGWGKKGCYNVELTLSERINLPVSRILGSDTCSCKLEDSY
jgi:hypothetical protein